MSTRFRLKLLGAAALVPADSESGPLLGPGKPLALLAYLHCAPAQMASREQLVELLWADVPPESGRHTLRQTLWYLKRRLGTEVVAASGSDSVQCVLQMDSDWRDFLTANELGRPDGAVRAYSGSFLPDFAAPGGAAFEQWADIERRRLETLYIGAATRLVRDRLEAGRAREAMQCARTARDLAPTSQACWRLLLEAQVAADDILGATAELQRLRAQLASDEMEVEPATESIARIVERASDRQATTATSEEPSRPASNLFTELVGREAAFGALVQAFERSRRGVPTHIHVSAPAGFGKTRLLEGFAGRLRAQRLRVVDVRAVPAERTLPFAFASQLVGALVGLRGAAAVAPDSASALVAMLPAASAHLRADPDRSTGDEAARRRTLAVLDLVHAVSEDSPLALLVDDVHWMDPASRGLLASIAERAGHTRLLLATSARSTDRFPELTPNATVLSLGPLSVEDIQALLASVAALPSAPWADLLPARLQTATSGSPLLVLETLQLALERGILGLTSEQWSCEDPAALIDMLGAGEAMQQRIASLPALATEALLVLSCMGQPARENALSHMVGSDVREALGLLEARGLILRVRDAWHPAHDVISAEVVRLASPAQREITHRAIADWLEQQPAGSTAAQLTRATWHRARANDPMGVCRAFTRLIERTRLDGLATPAMDLAREALGPEAIQAELDALIGRLPRRLRRRRLRGSHVAMLCLGMAVAALAAAKRGDAPAPAPEAVFQTVLLQPDGESQWVNVDLSVRRLEGTGPLDVRAVAAPLKAQSWGSLTGITARLPDGSWIGQSIDGRDSVRALDLQRLTTAGELLPLVSHERDQAGAAPSPDGQLLAYLDRRFAADQSAEVMLLDLATGAERRLTENADDDRSPVWSADGSTLAFLRVPRNAGVAGLCVLQRDVWTSSCTAFPDIVVPDAIHAIRADGTVVISGIDRRSSLRTLAVFDPESGRLREIDEGGSDYTIDPSGTFAICLCRTRGDSRAVYMAFALENPSSRRPLRFDGAFLTRRSRRWQVWESWTRPRLQVRVLAPDSAMVGERVRLELRAYDGEGREHELPFVRWRALDTTIASVDGDGRVSSRRAGVVAIEGRAGARLADTVELRMIAPFITKVFAADWAAPLARDWFALGEPLPFTTRTSDGDVLRINGDGVLVSGAISRVAIDARRGVGGRIGFRLPITRSQWQVLSVGVDATLSDSAFQAIIADRTRPPFDWGTEATRACELSMPLGEGALLRDVAGVVAAGQSTRISSPIPRFGDGRWHEASFQVFADGHCAVAIDDILLGVSETALPLDRPFRITLRGNSVGTTVEVGALEVWQGVKTDGPWRASRR